MSEFSNNKVYLRPDYSKEEIEESIGPSEDDDDFDDDDDEDIYDYDEDEEDKEIERLTEKQNKLNEQIMTQTPFGQPVSSNPSWGPQPVSTPWQQTTTPRWGGTQPASTPWQQTTTPAWGGTSSTSSGKKEIDRSKQVIFCDVLDCLIETLGSNGRPGLLPRGIYDIRLRFEVWDKLACFNSKKIFAIIPRNLILSSNGSRSWESLLNYVICALSEYIRVPFENFQIITFQTLEQRKEELMRGVISRNKIDKRLVVQIGLESGLYGQSNSDILAAQRLGIDYIDLGQLLSMYY